MDKYPSIKSGVSISKQAEDAHTDAASATTATSTKTGGEPKAPNGCLTK